MREKVTDASNTFLREKDKNQMQSRSKEQHTSAEGIELIRNNTACVLPKKKTTKKKHKNVEKVGTEEARAVALAAKFGCTEPLKCHVDGL